ncbi:sulfotransferase family 2 domain-containing protein [uncultured Thiohalocapsa sp.]|uniref:sulfotransferase family 2 domain-containing protein n=1 Tax=uncultured Thiohalocapsa sp. TaxID=768990 RepID=UPI00345D3987
MRISHQHRFVFLSNPQSGSTSIRIALDPYSDIKSSTEFPYHHHTNARRLKEHFLKQGWDWNSYFKFTTVRNPWDRMVARY